MTGMRQNDRSEAKLQILTPVILRGAKRSRRISSGVHIPWRFCDFAQNDRNEAE